MKKYSNNLFSISVIILIIISAIVIFLFNPIKDGDNRHYISVKNYTDYVSYGNYFTFNFKGDAWHTYKIVIIDIDNYDNITKKFTGETEVKTDIWWQGTFKLKLTSRINDTLLCYPEIYYDDFKSVDVDCFNFEFTVE